MVLSLFCIHMVFLVCFNWCIPFRNKASHMSKFTFIWTPDTELSGSLTTISIINTESIFNGNSIGEKKTKQPKIAATNDNPSNRQISYINGNFGPRIKFQVEATASYFELCRLIYRVNDQNRLTNIAWSVVTSRIYKIRFRETRFLLLSHISQ